jgi:AcrR family transcriptional regulator
MDPQVPRAGLSSAVVTSAAVELVDEYGPAALTLTAVADRYGVSAPSLYKHVRNLAELRDRVAVYVLDELTGRLTRAIMGRSGQEALRAIMKAYRQYVLDHPHRYAMIPQEPAPNPELDTAGTRLLEVVMAVLRGYGLTGAEAIHAARCLRATAHGFASLEAAGSFGLPTDLNVSYDKLVDILSNGFLATTDAKS